MKEFPSKFLKCVCEGEVSYSYKECFVPLSTDVRSHNTLPPGPSVLVSTCYCFVSLFYRCGISQSTSLRGTASSLAHDLVFDSDTICNDLSPPLVDIVFFGLSFLGFPSMFLKRMYYGKVSTPIRRMLRSPL